MPLAASPSSRPLGSDPANKASPLPPLARCRHDTADLLARPDAAAGRVSECLFGERVEVLERLGEWCRVRNRRDGYAGYLPREALDESPPPRAPSRLVGVRATLLFAEPDLKSPVRRRVTFGAELDLAPGDEGTATFARLLGGSFVWRAHCLRPGGALEGTPVELARRLYDGAPYRWGGRSPDGADCSGLVQGAALAAGLRLPRDSADQEAFLERIVPPCGRAASDLVFWPGHVALLIDADTLFHATAHGLATAVEPLADVVARAGEPSSIRRLPARGADPAGARRAAQPMS